MKKNLRFPDTEDLYQLGIEAGQFTFKKATTPLRIEDRALYNECKTLVFDEVRSEKLNNVTFKDLDVLVPLLYKYKLALKKANSKTK